MEDSMGKTALVTGAGMGVGYGIALELAKAGYSVMIHYNSSSKGAEALKAGIEHFGGTAVICQADIASVEGIRALFAAARETFGHLDVFVNNSGITDGDLIVNVTEEKFDRICDLNWKGTYFCIQQAARWMIETETKGSIVVIGSNQSDMVIPGNSLYGSVKYALNRLTQAAAMEFARYGIRVNCLAPGYVDTGAPRMGKKEPTYQEIPLRRWISLEEIGQVVLFLCGPFTQSLTGTTMIMDGGAHLIFSDPEKYSG